MKFRGLLLVTIISALLFESHGAEVCETDDCKAVAKEFQKLMNESADPCTNFWEYACGSLDDNHEIDPWATEWSLSYIFQNMVYNRTREILEEEVQPDDILPVKQAKKWYHSCMDNEALEKRELTPLETILVQVGGWPMTLDREEWDENAYTWQKIEELYFQITGSYIFYKFDFSESFSTTLTLQRGDIPLASKVKKAYRNLRSDEHKSYAVFLTAIVQFLAQNNNANITEEALVDDIADLIALEKMLIDIPDDDDGVVLSLEDFVKVYNEQTEGMTIKLNFNNLVQGLYDMVDFHPDDEAYDIETKNMNYFIELTRMINKIPKRTIINYLHWHFVSGMLSATTDDVRSILNNLSKKAFGVEGREPRWLECINEVKMSRALAYAYAQKYYPGETEKKAREMIEAIRGQMKKQIENSSWLDAKTKAVAVEKLSKMGVVLGVPDWFKNKTYVVNSYKGLIIDNNHFDNVLSNRKFEVRHKLRRKFLETGHDFEDDLDAMVINAYYSPSTNQIHLPAANFQKPLFTESVPNFVNFATTGAFIGHEIGHGFDSDGIKIGLNGEKTKIEKEVMDKYFDRAECFLKQYNDYAGETDTKPASSSPSSSVKSYGRRTLGENIADNAGFQSVLGSYKNLLSKMGEEKKLPGFEKFTDEQMFFITYAALWCDVTRPKYRDTLMSVDTHSLGTLRVIGVIANNKDFARVFNCPKGTHMNPDTKCTIWDD